MQKNKKKKVKDNKFFEFSSRNLIIILVILIAVAGAVYVCYELFCKPSAGIGDSVSVNYVGSFDNGTVFDTNIESVAVENGLNKSSYATLEFVIGSGTLIPGFENAIVDMKEGEHRTINLTPEYSYGAIRPELIINVPRIQKVDRYMNINKSEFSNLFGAEPVVGKDVNTPGLSWTIKIIGMNDSIVRVENIMSLGQVVQMPAAGWTSLVKNIDDKTIYLMQNPEVGNTFVLPTGNMLQGRVTKVSDSNFTIDMNHPLAGKNLIFDVSLIKITKSNETFINK